MPKIIPPHLLLLCVVIASWAFPNSTYSQSYDEFLEKVNAAVSKRDKAEVYLEMTEDFVENRPDTALSLANDLVRLVEGQNDKKAVAYLRKGQAHYYLDQNQEAKESLLKSNTFSNRYNKGEERLNANINYYLGTVLFNIGQFSEAQKYSEIAYEIAKPLNDPELSSYITYDLSSIEYNLGNIDKAVDYGLLAYKFDQVLNDSTAIYFDLNNLAVMYNETKQYDESLNYFKKSESYISPQDTQKASKRIVNYENIGNIFSKKFEQNPLNKEIDSAEVYFNKALSLSVNNNLEFPRIGVLLGYSNLELLSGNLNLSEQYLKDAQNLITKLKAQKYITRSKALESKIASEKKQYSRTLILVNELLDTSKHELSSSLYFQVLKRKSHALKMRGEIGEAYLELEKYLIEREEFINKESADALQRFRTIYDTDIKEERIKRLEQQQKEEKKRKQVGFSVLLALLILSVGFMLFLRYTFQQRRQIKALEYERLLSQRESQIESLQERVSTFVERPTQDPKKKEALPELTEINESLLTKITEREYDVLQSIEQGLSNKEIAEAHFISVNTVKYHLRNIYTKLDVSNRIQVIQRLRNFGF